MEPAEADRGRHHQSSAWLRALGLRGTFGLLDIRQNPARTLEVARADVGERHRAGGPLQQPGADPLFESGNQPRDIGGRQPHFSCGRRKAPEIGNRDKGGHGIDTVHGTIS